MQIRIGQGLDVHPFKAGRKLILAGIEIPHDKGLDGHSDADALIHAVIDAILGAMGEKDIGSLFPDTASTWKDADSAEMLKIVVKKMQAQKWAVNNLDLTVLTEMPKLSPYIDKMRENLSSLLFVSQDCCTIKAGTMEKMGFVGRGEGLMVQCVVLLKRAE